jgi:hypothetical protein
MYSAVFCYFYSSLKVSLIIAKLFSMLLHLYTDVFFKFVITKIYDE